MENTMIVKNDAAYDLTQPVPFGKYKGQPMSVLAADLNYCQWLTAQDWFSKSQPTVYNLIVNNFVRPEDTPEHNGFQARFLDKEYVKKLMKCVVSVDTVRKLLMQKRKYMLEVYEEDKDTFERIGSDYWLDKVEKSKRRLEWMDESLKNYDFNELMRNDVTVEDDEFEVKGWDYRARCYLNWNQSERVDLVTDSKYGEPELGVEIKPSIGDDFPTVLRQLKVQMEREPVFGVLVYDRFTGSGVTEDQMRAMIESSGFKVVRFDEIDAA